MFLTDFNLKQNLIIRYQCQLSAHFATRFIIRSCHSTQVHISSLHARSRLFSPVKLHPRVYIHEVDQPTSDAHTTPPSNQPSHVLLLSFAEMRVVDIKGIDNIRDLI